MDGTFRTRGAKTALVQSQLFVLTRKADSDPVVAEMSLQDTRPNPDRVAFPTFVEQFGILRKSLNESPQRIALHVECRLTSRLSPMRRWAKPAGACRLEALVMRHDFR